jgi:rhodanese-related sulfurtransferase
MFKFLLIVAVLGKVVVTSLSPYDFYIQLRDQPNVLLLDLRMWEDFETGHIENAQWAGNKAVLDSIVASHNKEEPVFIYCDHGQRTKAVIKLLKKSGYKQIVELEGGLDVWIRQGFTLSDK